MSDPAPNPTRSYQTTLIPLQETISWKIHNVSEMKNANAWSAFAIPMEVGLGATELSRWSISLVTRNKNSLLCARAILLSPQDLNRRVTHHLRIAVMDAEDNSSPVYYFPNQTNSNASTRNNANIRLTNNRNETNDDNNRCMKKLRRFFLKNAKLDEDEELGDGVSAKEARPGHKGHPSLWKVAPIDKIIPDADDCIELRVTLTVYGCDSVMQ